MGSSRQVLEEIGAPIVPLSNPTKKILNITIRKASFSPYKLRITSVIIFAKPSFAPGIEVEGMKDSTILNTILIDKNILRVTNLFVLI